MAWQGDARTTTPEHRRWRKAIMHRDDWTCQVCGHQGHPGDGVMQADHVINVENGGAPYDIDNGQALCEPCHKPKTQAEAQAGKAKRSRLRPTQRHPGLT